jgi:hypothetical protein
MLSFMKKLPENPYDGHTLKPTLESSERITGVEIDYACFDHGYKGHGVESDPLRNHTKTSSLAFEPDSQNHSKSNSKEDQKLSQ